MTEIKTNQKLEVNNVLSFRGKVNQMQLEDIRRDMETKLSELGAKSVGNPITATYGIEGYSLDVEILIPVDRNTGDIGNYSFKEKIKIVNAVVASYKGNPVGFQNACDELNQYIMKEQLQPITVGYNVTKKVEPLNGNNIEIDVYVGISPNIL